MFGIDAPELFVILLVLIVVVGPKDLPKMLRAMAKTIAYVRSIMHEFRYQFDDAMRQVECDDMQKTLSSISDLNSREESTETVNPTHSAREGMRDGFEGNTLRHKSEKEKGILECDQKKATNENSTTAADLDSSRSISVTSKERDSAL
ncbi:Sec-independent protein translocase protein TatB [Bartonella doshiae]|uniref:Sec-independent translocase n=2 Tax=Bartonella doshiae TaxID=33044 RepID=A0A380ZTG6_BARDO|nr:Sec-independent protein translocase protein TatB [Bartonella doshiae]EJF81881.1 twin arginine-targeting protein translocase TatB [Bartonella doshiae NCTC 12862 = ATCC 700133]MBB6159407.1 sec-independent protein translocase protein TatB [Bartonella doshiae]SUV44692.1 sec-independent translocase [Bartonella doshiae]SUV50443.1 sec-independent translocase [Bartonella doshiae]